MAVGAPVESVGRVGQAWRASSSCDLTASPSWARECQRDPMGREGPGWDEAFKGEGGPEPSEGPHHGARPGEGCVGGHAGPRWGWLNMDARQYGDPGNYVLHVVHGRRLVE
jgi:hypothetical protein